MVVIINNRRVSAKSGILEEIPANIRVVSYRTLRAIKADYDVPSAMARHVTVYVGTTGTGKSFRAHQEAGEFAYYKDPRSKFWCGYQGQPHVVIDEFRGAIDISHVLRWFDAYPVHVETKGSSTPLCATNYWVTSNLHPNRWYPDLDPNTLEALLRRLTIIEMNEPFVLS